MVFAHIFGMPVEETALMFAPVMLAVLVGARISGHRLLRKMRRSARLPVRGRHT